MLILGIESSCDETSAAIVRDGRELLSNVVISSLDLHKNYGGVIPEIAARSHIEAIIPVVDQTLIEAGVDWDELDGIAVTYGAGLGGSLLIGVLTARTLAITKNKKLYPINHVEGHVYANFITESSIPDLKFPTKQPDFPMLALIVSGGHSQLVLFRNHFDYELLGQTLDDAIGEAFDKVAKIIGLPYPGGPSIARAAELGDPTTYQLPAPRTSGIYDFSFSGLKTATLRLAQNIVGGDHTLPSWQISNMLTEDQKNNVAASFQYYAVKYVVDKTIKAFNQYRPKSVVIAGGVAASQELRSQLSNGIEAEIEYAPFSLCTDNGAMIATLGCYKASLDPESNCDPYKLEINPNLSM